MSFEISRITPQNGNINSQNVKITIYGNHFTSNVGVYFNNELLQNPVIKSSTITLTIPVLSVSGSNTIQLKTQTRESAVLYFNVYPAITSIAPNEGPLSGLKQIVVNGAGFKNTTTLYLENTQLTISSVSNNQLIALVPPFEKMGSFVIRAKQDNVYSQGSLYFTYIPPKITSISQNKSNINAAATITITGTNFGTDATKPSNLKVSIGGYTIPSNNVTYNNSQSLTVILPKEPDVKLPVGDVSIYVFIGAVKSNSALFTYLPVITGLSQNSTIMGDESPITITGYGFNITTSLNFGGKRGNSINVIDNNTLTVVPPHVKMPGQVIITLNTSKFVSRTTFPFVYNIYKITSVLPDKAYIDQANEISIEGEGITGEITFNIGANYHKKIYNEKDHGEVTFVLDKYSDINIGTRNISVSKYGSSSAAIPFSYMTRIIDITPDTIIANEFKILTVTVPGKCDISNSLFQLHVNGAYIQAMNNVSFTELEIPETCPKTRITKPIKRIFSILRFDLNTTQDVAIAADVSLYVDGILNDKSVIYYIAPFQIFPEKIIVDEDISFDISGSFFTSETKLIMDSEIYDYSEQTDTLLRFPLPSFAKNRFVNATLQLSEKVTTPIHFFVYPYIDYISSPAEEDETIVGATIVYVHGKGFDVFVPYVIMMNEDICEYTYISDNTLRIIIPEISTNIIDKQFTITIYDAIAKENLTIYSEPFTYSTSLVSIDPKYNGYSAVTQYATIYGNNFNDSTIVKFDNVDISTSNISERNDSRIKFSLPPSNISKVSHIYTITNNVRAINYLYYTYIPSINGLDINESTVNDSTTNITIYGERFKTVLGDMNKILLYWDDKEIPYTTNSSNTITLIAPVSSLAKSVPIYAKYAGISTNVVHFVYRPYIGSISHPTGYTCGGNTVFIYGKGFGKNTRVLFGSAITEFLEITETSIKFIVPPSTIGDFIVNISVEVNTIKSVNEITYSYKLPSLLSISKTNGAINGGYEIVISGEGFYSDVEILFGSVVIPSSEFVRYDANIITLITPEGMQAGEITIQLRVANMLSDTQLSFTYLNHTIESIYPDHGRICGGEIVVITGEGLSHDIEFLFGSVIISGDTFIETNSKYIRFKTPTYFKPEIVSIKSRLNGVYSENILKYQYKPHTITSVYPDNSPLSGNEIITIRGSGLASDDLILKVGNHDIPSSAFLSQSAAMITFYSPQMKFAGTYDLVAIISNIPSEKPIPFYYTPRIIALSHAHVPIQISIILTIHGEGFSSKSIIRFGCIIIMNPTYDATYGTLSFATPLFEISQHVLIQVVVDDVATNYEGFYITPVIKTITPMPWLAGDTGELYIRGSGFAASSYVSVQNNCKSTLISPNKITPTMIAITLPVIKESGEVKIGINSDLNEWVYYTTAVYPKITRLSESKGSILGNNTIYIYGYGFVKNMRVKIGSSEFVNEKDVEFINNSTYSVKMPPSTTIKEVNLALWNQNIISNYVSYTYSPYITNITPNWAPLYSERHIVISGVGFNDMFSVLFQNKIVSSQLTKINYDTKDITVILPASYEVEKKYLKLQIEFENVVYESANVVEFYYAPEILSISKNSATVTGQEEVTINGRGFYANTFLKFGKIIIRSENITVISSTQLIVKLPIFQKQGTYGITVITNNIPSAIPFPFAISAEIGSANPSSAPTSGNLQIIVNGSGFTDELTLLYNSIIIPYKLLSDTQLQFQLPDSIPGENLISLNCSRYATALSINLLCYPTISYIKQQYDRDLQKIILSLYGSGFTTNSRISIGERENLVPILHDNILVLSVTEYNNYTIEPALPVTVTTNGYTSADTISYSNFPLISSINKTSGSVGGNEEIIITGAGFDKKSIVLLVEKNMEIVPSVVYANQIVFNTPAISESAIVHFIVKSNNSTSRQIQFNYAPYLKSTSINYCNVGDEPFIKLYGDGFEKYNTQITVDNDLATCTFSDFINDKIIQGKLTAFDYPGILNLSVSVRQIDSINSVTFEIKPIIRDINQEFANIHGGKVTILGKGIANATSASFVYKTRTYIFPIISQDSSYNNYSQYTEENVVLQYSSIPELMKILTQNNNQALPIDLYLHVNGAKSLPYKWQIRHIHHDAEIDNEIAKILYLCNQYLSTTFLVTNFQIITPYSFALQSTISDAIISIFQLTGEYLNPKSQLILSNAIINICAKTLAPQRAVHNMISQLVDKILFSLQSGFIISTSLVSIQSPLSINKAFSYYSPGKCDYYFQELVCEHEPIICANEFHESLYYKIDASMNVQFQINTQQLSRTCTKLAKSLLHSRFILCNNQGKFVGTTDDAPDGNIPELFIYKLLSATIHHPYQTSNIIDTHKMKMSIANSEQYLTAQMLKLFQDKDVLETIYTTLVVTYNRNREIDGDCFHPLPFKSGDRLRIPLLIGGNIIFTNPSTQTTVNIRDLFYGACDTDSDNKTDAFSYLLTYDGTKVKSTNDIYEITMN